MAWKTATKDGHPPPPQPTPRQPKKPIPKLGSIYGGS
ncbi:unnamed protein product [Rhodiola kirilowii]